MPRPTRKCRVSRIIHVTLPEPHHRRYLVRTPSELTGRPRQAIRITQSESRNPSGTIRDAVRTATPFRVKSLHPSRPSRPSSIRTIQVMLSKLRLFYLRCTIRVTPSESWNASKGSPTKHRSKCYSHHLRPSHSETRHQPVGGWGIFGGPYSAPLSGLSPRAGSPWTRMGT
jgi:hypothetical protein